VNRPADPISPLGDKDNAFPRCLLNAIDGCLDSCRIVCLAIPGCAEASMLQVHGMRVVRPHRKHRLGGHRQSGRCHQHKDPEQALHIEIPPAKAQMLTNLYNSFAQGAAFHEKTSLTSARHRSIRIDGLNQCKEEKARSRFRLER
jgi:hypothetical protein